jgi:hypothetical protein
MVNTPATSTDPRTVSYTVDLDGVLTHIESEQWERFAMENGAAALADPASVVGKRLEDFIIGPAKYHVRMLVRMLRGGQYPDFGYTFRCDAPHKDRLMRMVVHPVTSGDGAASGLQFSSTIVAEEDLFECVLLYHEDAGENAPFLRMCSYCKRVDHRDAWMAPREYEASGAETRVRLSHVICPDCERDIVEPMLMNLHKDAGRPGL